MSAFYLSPHFKGLSENHPLARLFDIPFSAPNRGIMLLFRTVILNAVYDGLKGCPEAKKWLLTPSADMQQVADYANLTPAWVQRVSIEVLSNKHPMPPYRIWRYLWADLQQKEA